MRWICRIQNLLPIAFGLFVGMWLGSIRAPRATLVYPSSVSVHEASLALSPRGRFLVSFSTFTRRTRATPEVSAQFWDLSRNRLCSGIERDETNGIENGRFSPDERQFVVRIEDEKVQIWNPLTGKCEGVKNLKSGWTHSLAFSKGGNLIDFRETGFGTTIAYEVESGRELYRLPKGAVTPLCGDLVLHYHKGRMRLFHIDDGMDSTKPYLQSPYEQWVFDEAGQIKSGHQCPHSFSGSTQDGKVLFGIVFNRSMYATAMCFCQDFQSGKTATLDSLQYQVVLRPSWSGKYLLRSEENTPPDWWPNWLSKSSKKCLTLQDYGTKQTLLTIPGGESAAFSLDDRVMAVHVGNGKIQIWDLPLRTPCLLSLFGGLCAWSGASLILKWGVRRGVRGQASAG